MKTLDIEVALLTALNIRQNIIVPNISFGISRKIDGKCHNLHECDILSLTKSNYATEYEIKVSKSDFKADKKKKHKHNSLFIKYFCYVVPLEMKAFAEERLEEGQGLIIVTDKLKLSYVALPKEQKCVKWTDEERLKLAHLGCMRIKNLKTKISKNKL